MQFENVKYHWWVLFAITVSRIFLARYKNRHLYFRVFRCILDFGIEALQSVYTRPLLPSGGAVSCESIASMSVSTFCYYIYILYIGTITGDLSSFNQVHSIAQAWFILVSVHRRTTWHRRGSFYSWSTGVPHGTGVADSVLCAYIILKQTFNDDAQHTSLRIKYLHSIAQVHVLSPHTRISGPRKSFSITDSMYCLYRLTHDSVPRQTFQEIVLYH